MELNWQVDVDEASPKPFERSASIPTFPQTHCAPSQMHLRTSGIFGCQCYNAVGCCCCSGYAAERPPPADPSIGGGLVASATLGVPSGHPEGGSEGVLPPLDLIYSAFSAYSSLCRLPADRSFAPSQVPFGTSTVAERAPTRVHGWAACVGRAGACGARARSVLLGARPRSARFENAL